MRCKKHYSDFSSTVGVCACCLRERLFTLIAAQEQALAHIQTLDGKHRNSDRNPASVSPFINTVKTDNSVGVQHNHLHNHQHHHTPAVPRRHYSYSDQLFYTTPAIRPNNVTDTSDGYSNKKRRFRRFFSFPNIFRSRNRKSVDSVTDPTVCESAYADSYGGGNGTSSPSWFSIIYHGRRRRKPSVNVDEADITVSVPVESTVTGAGRPVRRNYCRDRGMSPVRNSDVAGEDIDELSKGYESTESWKNTPRRTPARRGGGHVRNLSGMTFCLSPLVRASPNRQRNQKGIPSENVLSGEIRAPVKPHLANTKSFCANRSRKLADFGRPNLNR
ncbi:uncharacterized protein [Rutidosis leptorrhynchoides]|uniref:uncharacterized protein n=1 Tax=Rutidosis leptorrhynchoides TaxID=125765 RepID=UPI003A98D09F